MGTVLTGTAVFGALIYTVYRMIKNKKKGGGCIGCPSYGNCSSCNHAISKP